jgi:putative FmdB family regulatory protein
MPIYEYRCTDCGFQNEYLQRMSDAPLTDCPECGKPSFSKMVTAAGFQLKGSGWYATDFKNNGTKPKKESDKPAEGAKKEESKPDASCGAGACAACS